MVLKSEIGVALSQLSEMTTMDFKASEVKGLIDKDGERESEQQR